MVNPQRARAEAPGDSIRHLVCV